MLQSKIYAPPEWGKITSNTHYAFIDGMVYPVRPTLDFVKYKGRWRPIQVDGSGQHFVEWPGGMVSFTIKEFDKHQTAR